MAALGKAGAAGARETWLSRFLTASCAWAKRAEVQIPSGGTRGSSPSVTVNHGLTEGQNRAGTANSAAASAPVAISARWECLATQRVLAPTANPVAAAVQSGWRALLPSHARRLVPGVNGKSPWAGEATESARRTARRVGSRSLIAKQEHPAQERPHSEATSTPSRPAPAGAGRDGEVE